jgi:hypothetical protein
MRMKKSLLCSSIIFSLVVLFCTPGYGQIKFVEILKKEPYAKGATFGAHGPYEILTGRVHYELNPYHPLNCIITDLDKSPKNDKGFVEFSTDVRILKPVDMQKGSQRLFYYIVNRGGVAEGFNELLLNRGFTIVWSRWQGDILPGKGLLSADFPVAKNPDGSSITGSVMTTFMLAKRAPEEPSASLPLSYDGTGGYIYRTIESVSADNANSRLTSREYALRPRVEIPRSRWAFAKAHTDGSKGAPSTTDIWLEGKFQPGLIYELVYQGKNPVVMGLGFAAIRDLNAFLKYASQGNPVAVPGGMKAAYIYGKSQSGRFLREYLKLGFNQDEEGRKVFEGMLPDAPGGSVGFFNYRFCLPGRANNNFEGHNFLTDIPPFSYSTTTDPYTRVTGSLLDKAIATNTVPQIIQVQTSAEYWTRSGSLAHLLPDLSGDQEFPQNVRYYHLSSTQHSPSTKLSKNAVNQLPSNPANYGPVIRALIVALDDWATKGTEPPPSALPRLADGTIGDWRKGPSGFPDIPGINYPAAIHEPPILDLSSLRNGVLTQNPIPWLPPGLYQAYAPKVDADGNEIAGVRVPDIQVPIGTYTGWNLRTSAYNSFGTNIINGGSFIPFARTKAERLASGDPRPSIEERYKNREDYIQKVTRAARDLEKQRLLLPEDAAQIIRQAEKTHLFKK